MNKSNFSSLSTRILFALLLTGIIPLIIYLNLNKFMAKKSFHILENKSIHSQIQYTQKILQNEMDSLAVTAMEYATWDDVYQKMSLKPYDKKWFKNNYSDWLPHNLDIDLMVLASNSKKILDSHGLEKVSEDEVFQTKAVRDILNGSFSDFGEFPNGIISYNDGLYILAVAPIRRTDHTGPPRGALILGKQISPKLLESIKEKFGYELSVVAENQLIGNSNTQKLLNKFHKILLKNKKTIVELDNFNIAGLIVFPDIYGLKDIKVYTFLSRDVFSSTIQMLNKNIHFTLIASFILIFVLSYWLRGLIASPIVSLEKQIKDMNEQSTLKYIKSIGSIEVKSLVKSFNLLVDTIHKKEYENKTLKLKNNTDDLTSLYNHRHCHEILKLESTSKFKPMSIIFMDVDKFKAINDSYGHVLGDEILKIIGKILKKHLSKEVKGFRYGGDEFAIIAPNFSLDKAYLLAENIRSHIVRSRKLNNFSLGFPITVSLGVASFPDHCKSRSELLNKADRAMYFAKQNGRNQSYIYNENIENLLSENSENFRQKEIMLDSTLAFAAAIDAKDHYTGNHSEMVTKYSLLISEKLGISDEDKYFLRIGALLHDCGKIGIPDDIIGKKDKLSPEEYDIIKQHPILGNTILKHIINSEAIMSCVRNHHERWDGNGYPDGLSGNSIHLNARIVCIADAFHSMISDRPYRKGMKIEEAVEELKRNSGTQFDSNLVELFIQALNETEEYL